MKCIFFLIQVNKNLKKYTVNFLLLDAKSEDDGVLITIAFDGTREQSYLMFTDARTFTPINQAYLPHNIPWSAHGMYFPEANHHNKDNTPLKKKKIPKEEL